MHDLAGLSAASPIGYLAALGLLRVLSSDLQCKVRLGWRNSHAVFEGALSKDTPELLMNHIRSRAAAPEFNWTDSLRNVGPEQFRSACGAMSDESRALGFMAGWASDAVLIRGNVAVTRMDMSSGQQKLLRDLRRLAAKITRTHIKSAFYGGPYMEQASYGLDPIAVRCHAHECQAPTKSNPPGKPGLVWLAFESIPLHPVIPGFENRAYTTGWRRPPGSGYVWPIWEGFLELEEVVLLRSLPVEHLFGRPGVAEVWSSNYGASGKYGALQPAQREA